MADPTTYPALAATLTALDPTTPPARPPQYGSPEIDRLVEDAVDLGQRGACDVIMGILDQLEMSVRDQDAMRGRLLQQLPDCGDDIGGDELLDAERGHGRG